MVITEKTKFQDSKLTINVVPLVGRCRNCHSETRVVDFDFVCSECSSRDLEIIHGEELNISHLEVD
jgi:hydrogenase nickel incorporation protein HypA/HybF